MSWLLVLSMILVSYSSVVSVFILGYCFEDVVVFIDFGEEVCVVVDYFVVFVVDCDYVVVVF